MAIIQGKERVSERRMAWAVVAILGANILGVDVQQIIALATNADKYIVDLQQSLRVSGISLDSITLPGVVAVYIWCRTEIKKRRQTQGGPANGAE